MIGEMMVPGDIHVPIPTPCEDGTFHGKRGFADVRILSGGMFRMIQVGSTCNHRAPCRREAGRSESEKEMR